MKALTEPQILFLEFAAVTPIFTMKNGLREYHSALPLKGAVATSVLNALMKRGYVNYEGTITATGRRALVGLRAA